MHTYANIDDGDDDDDDDDDKDDDDDDDDDDVAWAGLTNCSVDGVV